MNREDACDDGCENGNDRDKGKSNSSDYIIGKKLYCLNGETVILRAVNVNSIIIEYKTQSYKRDKSLLGTKLLNKNPIDDRKVKSDTAIKTNKGEEITEIKKLNRKLYKDQIAQDRKRSIKSTHPLQFNNNELFSDAERENWPEEMRYKKRFRKWK